MAKKDVNRLKIMLAVTKRSTSGWQKCWVKTKQPFLNGAPTLVNQTWKP